MPFADLETKRAYQREWIRKNREDWLLRNGPCACGSWDRLEVDHIEPGTKLSHRIWSWSATRRRAELAKCRALCFECHKKRHGKGKQPNHGTARGYDAGCRCRGCTDAKLSKNKRYRGPVAQTERALIL